MEEPKYEVDYYTKTYDISHFRKVNSNKNTN